MSEHVRLDVTEHDLTCFVSEHVRLNAAPRAKLSTAQVTNALLEMALMLPLPLHFGLEATKDNLMNVLR